VLLAEMRPREYIGQVVCLTKQERQVLYVILGLLLVGLTVKTFRTAHLAAAKPGQGTLPATASIQRDNSQH
jgi:hypothetical protein